MYLKSNKTVTKKGIKIKNNIQNKVSELSIVRGN